MADPLSLLRTYTVNKKEIKIINDYICFGEYCWPKTVKTNYVVYGTSRDGPDKEYYTLECLLFILNRMNENHPIYVKQAANEGVPVVRRPDRKELLSYLVGESTTSSSIDRSAPLELPISYSEVIKLGNDVQQNTLNLLNLTNISYDDQDETIPSKIPKLDVVQKAKEQFSARLDAPKLKKPISTISGDGSILNDQSFSTKTTSLSEAMGADKINALKAKRLAKKRNTIIDAENEFDKETSQTSGVASSNILIAYDASFTKEIQSKERVWRNRSTILQSAAKNFNKSLFPILQSIKNREEGGVKKPNSTNPANNFSLVTPLQRQIPTANSNSTNQLSQQQYNRYDQERFNRSDPSIGFKIDTTGSYHGLQLKNVTEGSVPKSMPNQPLHLNSSSNQQSSGQKPTKRVSRTPIIIIPATPSSLITMNNSKCILQELKFVDAKSLPNSKEVDVLIQRRKPDNSTVMYRIIDSPLKLQQQDWSRVVAVFVQGPLWQFKGWPWNGNPVEIFARIKAFHLKFDEMKLDANVAKWNVEVIELSRNKRHLDRANLLKFWSHLDQHMMKYHKNTLKF